MNVDVKRTKSNKFITTILNKIELAKHFHQRCALSITAKRILGCASLKFYLRRRYHNLYLYIRLQGNFGNIAERHKFYKDFIKLIPELQLESTQGHYTGWTLQLTNETEGALIYLLKLCSLLSKPKDFYVKNTKIFKCFYNYQEASDIPIHLQITNTVMQELECTELLYYLNTSIKEFNPDVTNS